MGSSVGIVEEGTVCTLDEEGVVNCQREDNCTIHMLYILRSIEGVLRTSKIQTRQGVACT